MTGAMIDIVPFGGCGLNAPLGTVYAANREPVLFRDRVGYVRPPFALSATAANQLVDFLDGSFDIPLWIRRLMFGDPMHRPTPEQASHIRKAHVALVEMSTPLDYVCDGFYLNINRFEEAIERELRDLAIDKKVLSGWRSALLKSNEDVRADLAAKIVAQIPTDTEIQRNMAAFVAGTRSITRTPDEMRTALGEVREKLGMPLGLIIHNFQFMPDGRALSWPASFKNDSVAVAQSLDIPTYDFAEFVVREGVAKIMADDRRHWNKAHYFTLGEMLYNFGASIVGAAPFALKKGIKRNSDALGNFADTDIVMRSLDLPTQDEMWGVNGAPGKAAAPQAIRRYLTDPATGSHMPADDKTLFAFLLLGSGWAMGANGQPSDASSNPMPSLAGHSWMFDRGLMPRNKIVRKLVDLDGSGIGAIKESPAVGMADHILRNCQARFGKAPNLFFATFARSGTSLDGIGQTEDDGLKRGTRLYADLLYHVQRARDLAAARGQRLEVAGVCMLGGEYEAGKRGNPAAYRRGLSLLQQALDADLRVITGQVEPVRLLVSQTNRATVTLSTPVIPMAQLRVQDDNPHVRCVGPTYHVEPEEREGAPAAYPRAAGYRRIGQQFGHFVVDDLWGPHADPLRVADAWWESDRAFVLRYNRPLALETDDERIVVSTLGAGLGIDVLDGHGRPVPVKSIAVGKDDACTVAVTLEAAVSTRRTRVLIAARRTNGGGIGRIDGPRSGIRSQDPYDTDPQTGSPLFDWACTEEVTLSA